MHWRARDITGMRFGHVVAIKPTFKRDRNSVVWECKCDCGNICYKSVVRLTVQPQCNCGCIKGSHPRFFATVNGERLSLMEISRKYNKHITSLRKRYHNGIVGDEIIKNLGNFPDDTETDAISFSDIARKVGVSRQAIHQRYLKGCRGEALTRPVEKGGRKRNEQKQM